MAKTDAATLLEGQDMEALESEAAEASEQPTADAETNDLVEQPTDEAAPAESEAESTEAAEQPELDITQRLLDLGFENVDESNGTTRLLDSYQQQQEQLQQLQQQVSQMQPLVQYGQQHLAQIQQEQTPAAPDPEEAKPWWSPPSFEHAWMERYREADPSNPGQFRWKDNTPAEVIANTQSYQQYIQDWADDLTSRPHEILPPIIEQVAEQLFDRLYSERREQEQSGSFVEDLRSQHGDWLYERDPRTNQLTDRLSPAGQRAMDLASDAQQMGITDPREQWQYVERMRRLEELESKYGQDQKQQTAREKAATNRQTHRKRGVSTQMPARGGSATEPNRPQNENLSPGQQLIEALVEEGAQFS